MNKTLQSLRIFLALSGFLAAGLAVAQDVNAPSPPEGTKEFAEYDVHYSTFNSLFVPADTASAYHLVRAKDQTLINISVQKKNSTESVPAQVEGRAKNLMQQVKTIDFKTISERDAIYYIGSLKHSNEEILHLDITITPEGNPTPLNFRLTRKLYTEN